MPKVLVIALLSCVYLAAAPVCPAQQTAGASGSQGSAASGTIRGTVTDQLGAVIAGATIKVTGIQAVTTSTAKSNDEGKFNVADLPFADYAVEISAPGFATYHINVSLGKDTSRAPHDAQLQVGMAVAQINVHLSVVGDGLTLSCIVCQYTYFSIPFEDLPFRYRDPQRLVALQPGVTEHKQNFSIAGSRLTDKTALLNGFDNRDPVTGSFIASLSLNSTQEFNSTYRNPDSGLDSSYGQIAEGQLSATTRSGTNTYHGQALWFLERTGPSANNFFTNRGGLPADQVMFDQAGGNIGGPLSLPGIFNGRDHLFFFASYEHTRDFSVRGRQIVAPLASFISRTAPSQGPLFRNALAAGRVPLSPGKLGGLTDVDGDGLPDLGDASVRAANRLHGDLGLVRIDAAVRTNITLNAFYDTDRSQASQDAGEGGFTPASPLNASHRGQLLGVRMITTLSPRMVNDFGLARRFWSTSLSGGGSGAPQLIAVNSPLDVLGGAPGLPEVRQGHAFVLSETFSGIFSQHTVRTGVQMSLRDESYTNSGLAGGRVYYSDLLAMMTDGRMSAGDPRFSVIRAEVATDSYAQRYRPRDLYAFATDTWRPGRRTVVNFGLGYNYYSAAIYDGVKSDKTNFAPSLSFAIALTKSELLILRGTASMVYLPPALLDYAELSATPLYPVAAGFARLSDLTGSPVPSAWTGRPGALDIERQFAGDFRTGYTKSALLALQYTPGRLFTLEAAYNTSLAHRLPSIYAPGRQNLSQVAGSFNPATASDAQIFFIASDANSSYHSLQVRLTSREHRRMVFQVHYTLSKSIDTVSDSRPSIFNTLGLGPVYAGGPALERGLSDFDRRHRVVGFFSWRLGEPGAIGGLLHTVLGGWQANGVITLQSGSYVSLYSTGDFYGGRGDFNTDGILNDRLAYLASGSLSQARSKGRSPADAYFSGELFGAPGANRALGRNVLPAPGYASIDLSLQKKIAITEAHSIQMRIEVFNLTNRANFAPPVTDLVSADFGRSREAGAPRAIRFKLGYAF